MWECGEGRQNKGGKVLYAAIREPPTVTETYCPTASLVRLCLKGKDIYATYECTKSNVIAEINIHDPACDVKHTSQVGVAALTALAFAASMG